MDESRKEFEDTIRRQQGSLASLKCEGGGYVAYGTNLLWLGWQAAVNNRQNKTSANNQISGELAQLQNLNSFELAKIRKLAMLLGLPIATTDEELANETGATLSRACAALEKLFAKAPCVAIDQVMEQAQVFASAWSLVGGRFDTGSALEDANEEKANLRLLVLMFALNQKEVG